MAQRKLWSPEEAQMLLELFLREEREPSRDSIVQLSEQLREAAPRDLAGDPSYRSAESLRTRIYYLRLLASHNPSAVEVVPGVFREVWEAYERSSQSGFVRRSRTGAVEGGAAADRSELISALEKLEQVLGVIVRDGEQWLPPDLVTPYRAAWEDIERIGYFPQATALLRGPAVDPFLEAQGLVGLQREPKTRGLFIATEWFERLGGRKRLQKVLQYADVLLGSLTPIMPWFEPVKEFKEGAEASVDLAFEEKEAQGTSPRPSRRR